MTLLKPAQKRGKLFLNPVPTAVGGLKMALKVLPLYLRQREETEPRQPLGPFRTDAGVYATPPASGLRVTWFGHSSSLMEIDGVRVLVDPVWDERASPFSGFGPRRFFAPTLPLAELPRLAAVLISHDHYDHLGKGTVRQLARLQPAARWVTPLGVGRRLKGFGVAADRITELDWTQSVEIGSADQGGPDASVRIACWPARHFSGRSAFDRFTTLWGSFVLEGPQHRVYYGADTGYWDGLAEISAQYGGFDLTLLEIGAYNDLWADIHLGPDGAARAFAAMGGNDRAGLLMPIHWGLFNLALHAWRQPIERLKAIAKADGGRLWSPRPGKPTELVRGQDVVSDWYNEASK
jgi:L-ascorbate metabolism protein UlaG (beta-lactamase superfamily)